MNFSDAPTMPPTTNVQVIVQMVRNPPKSARAMRLPRPAMMSTGYSSLIPHQQKTGCKKGELNQKILFYLENMASQSIV